MSTQYALDYSNKLSTKKKQKQNKRINLIQKSQKMLQAFKGLVGISSMELLKQVSSCSMHSYCGQNPYDQLKQRISNSTEAQRDPKMDFSLKSLFSPEEAEFLAHFPKEACTIKELAQKFNLTESEFLSKMSPLVQSLILDIFFQISLFSFLTFLLFDKTGGTIYEFNDCYGEKYAVLMDKELGCIAFNLKKNVQNNGWKSWRAKSFCCRWNF